MKKTKKFAGIEFVELKDDFFYYCGKCFAVNRYVSKDYKIYISMDNGFDYAKIGIGTKDGKVKFINDVYHKGDRYGYPIYDLNKIVTNFLKLKTPLIYSILVNSTQLK
jgi:hypothetical protein